ALPLPACGERAGGRGRLPQSLPTSRARRLSAPPPHPLPARTGTASPGAVPSRSAPHSPCSPPFPLSPPRPRTRHPLTPTPSPPRPLRAGAPCGAGGGNHGPPRLWAQRRGPALGQNFIVDNRPGAAGTIGTRAVARAAADGYTLMVGHSGVFGVAPSLYANPGYDPRKDFAPIGLIGSFQQILVVHPALPIKTVADLIAIAKREPGRLSYASAGIGSGSHLSTELFAAMAGIRLTHVPFRGTGATLTDLIAGRVDMMIPTLPSVIGAVRAGQLRPVAVTGEARSPLFPELPTFVEAGVPGYVAVIHYGMVAPAGLPAAIGDKLNGALNAALADAQIRARTADEGG